MVGDYLNCRSDALHLLRGKTLASITGSPDVVFGQVVSGRTIDLDNALHASGPLFK